MKTRLFFIIPFGALALYLTACGGDGNSSTQPDPPTNDSTSLPDGPVNEIKDTSLPYEKDAIYLSGLYATSTGQGNPESLFDRDENTSWTTMKGACINEGVMLYFPAPQYIENVILLPAKGENLNSVRMISTYVNGSPLELVKPGDPIVISATCNSLFFRIESLEDQSIRSFDKDEIFYDLTVFDAGKATGFSEIRFTGEGGGSLKVRPMPTRTGKVSATSTLEPEASYSTAFLFDSRDEFGWAEGVKGSGAGEKLTFEFDEDVRIQKIRLWNGYQRSAEHFQANARARTISFGLSGTPGVSLPVKDDRGPQDLDLGSTVTGKSFTLSISEVFEGKAYPDLVLSELRFFDGETWFSMKTGDEDRRKEAFKLKSKGTPLAEILDRNLGSTFYQEGEFGLSGGRSLILRSNGSFVMYLEDTEYTAKMRQEIQKISDGNWDIIESGPNSVKVRISGKLRRTQDRQRYYKGNSKSDQTHIFNEFLTITPGMVRGEKVLDQIYTRVPK